MSDIRSTKRRRKAIPPRDRDGLILSRLREYLLALQDSGDAKWESVCEIAIDAIDLATERGMVTMTPTALASDIGRHVMTMIWAASLTDEEMAVEMMSAARSTGGAA